MCYGTGQVPCMDECEDGCLMITEVASIAEDIEDNERLGKEAIEDDQIFHDEFWKRKFSSRILNRQ